MKAGNETMNGRSYRRGSWRGLFFCLAAAVVTLLVAGGMTPTAAADSRKPTRHFELTSADKECIECHEGNNPGMVRQWKHSMHAKGGGLHDMP